MTSLTYFIFSHTHPKKNTVETNVTKCSQLLNQGNGYKHIQWTTSLLFCAFEKFHNTKSKPPDLVH